MCVSIAEGQARLGAIGLFLTKSRPRWDTAELGLIDYLARRLGSSRLMVRPDAFDTAMMSYIREPEFAAFQGLRRLHDRDSSVDPTTIDDVEDPLLRVLLTGLALIDDPMAPVDLERAVANATAAGGYDLTHAALVAAWLIEHRSPTQVSESSLRLLRTGLADLARSIEVVQGVWDPQFDLAVEAIAVAVHAGWEDLVPDSSDDLIVAWQASDGSFGSIHATAVALWALVELWKLGDATEPMVPA